MTAKERKAKKVTLAKLFPALSDQELDQMIAKTEGEADNGKDETPDIPMDTRYFAPAWYEANQKTNDAGEVIREARDLCDIGFRPKSGAGYLLSKTGKVITAGPETGRAMLEVMKRIDAESKASCAPLKAAIAELTAVYAQSKTSRPDTKRSGGRKYRERR